MKKLLLILSLSLTMAACKKEPVESNYLTSVDSVKEHILGTWESEKMTDRPLVYTITREFTKDSMFTVYSYPPDSKYSYKYEVHYEKNEYNNRDVYNLRSNPVMPYDDFGDIVKLSDEELHLRYSMGDFSTKYKRVE